MEQIIVGDIKIEYTIIWSERKTIGLIVDPEKGVIIRAPRRLTKSRIKEVVKMKSNWLINKIEEIKKIKSVTSPIQFKSGEKFPYLGKEYRLRVYSGRNTKKAKIVLSRGEFQIKVSSLLNENERKNTIREIILQWYKGQAKTKIQERVTLYQERMGVKPNRVVVKEQKKRWGSCSSKGNLNINWRLIMAPLAVIDYIVVHELAHLIHPNHSNDFWQFVKVYFPDYKKQQEWLKSNGAALYF